MLNIVFATGNTVGASLGGYLADTIGWRWFVFLRSVYANAYHLCRAFLIQVPITIIAIIAVSLALHLPKKESGDFVTNLKRVDFGGAFFLVLTVFFLLFALDRGGNISWNDRYTISALVGFGVCFIAFSFVEMELASEPFAPKRIIINRSLIASYFVNFFGIASGFSLIFHLALYFQAVQGKTATEASLWLVVGVLSSVTGSLGGGLIMQSTGKFYAITVLGYAFLFFGSSIVALTSGVVVASSLGIAIGKSVNL